MRAARRLTVTTLVSLCAMAVGLLVWSASALAAVAPVLGEESVVNVSSDGATLRAQIDPEGAETTYVFEYGTGVSYGASVPLPAGLVGSGTSAVAVQVHVQGLQPDTTYHYRVVASSEGGVERGLDQVFTTQTTAGGELGLLDGRQWELVSPPNKHGAGLEEPDSEGGLIQAADNGDAITYLANGPVVAEPVGNRALEYSQVLSRRGPGGWETRDITTPSNEAQGFFVGEGTEYRFFSDDLSLGLVEPRSEMPLSPETTEVTPYLRENTSGGYQPLLTAANVPPGTKFGNPEPGSHRFSGEARFVGASPDMRHVVLASLVALTPGSGGGLYEWSGGQLQLVSVLPDGAPASDTCVQGLGSGQEVRHAISNDGSRVVWTGCGGLLVRDTATKETIEVTGAQNTFQTANSEVSKVFFTSNEALTPDASSGTGLNLYEFDVESGALTDLTVATIPGESVEVEGAALGASEDGSYVYFVARGVLAGGNVEGRKPAAGANNLYVAHEMGGQWTTTFITTLPGGDENDWARGFSGLFSMTSRVSANGRYVAFMSEAPLTGYDNIDANSGQPDEEAFLYDATSDRLVCASCDPTGARPVGVFDAGLEAGGLLVDSTALWGGHWLAASIPGGTPVDLLKAFYQSRALSSSGRLFFDSADALVPQDTNSEEDVYEYEPEGVGSCGRGSVTFSERSGGCVDLISSGASGSESVFLDASETGGDVFFLTTARLVSEDVDSALDVYDAHECTGESPCLAPAAVAPPVCTTADSCRAAPSPQPAIFGAPPSATFTGSGDLAPPVVKPVVKSKKHKQSKRSKKGKKSKKGRKSKKGKASRHGRRSTAWKSSFSGARRGERG